MKRITLFSTLKLIIPISIFQLLTSQLFAGTSYTWTGMASKDWATALNWSPSGVPSSGDNVTIPSTTNQLKLDQSRTINSITVTTDTLNLNGYTLTVTGAATFNSGFVNNGALTISSTGPLSISTFKGTSFGAAVYVTSNSIELSGGTFSSTLTVVKNGSSNDVGKGNCTFSAAVTLIDSASGSLTLSDSLPDTFSSSLDVKVRSTGNIYIAHRGTGNVFNSNVTAYSSNSGTAYFCYYGTATFNKNVIINSTGSGGCNFCNSTGSCTLSSGFRLSIGTDGYSSGKLGLRNFTQSGSSDTTNLTFTGSATSAFGTGCVWNAPIIISAPIFSLEGNLFKSTASFTYTSSTGASSVGGNYFKDVTSITNNSSGSAALILGSTTVDTFKVAPTILNSAGTIQINNAVFVKGAFITNTNHSSSADKISIAPTGTCDFQDAVTLSDTVGGIVFGASGGTTVLESGAVIHFNSTFTGNLKFKNLSQTGSDTVSIPMLNNSDDSKITIESSVINGPFIFNGKHILLNSSTFNSSVNIRRILSNAVDTSSGGNVFNSTVSITDSSSSAHHMLLAYASADTYNGNVTYIQKGSSSTFIQPAYAANSTFKGNIAVDGTAAIPFGANGGKVIFSGSVNDTIKKSGSYNPTIKKLEINKSSGSIKLNLPLTVSDSLILTKGNILSDTSNILSIADNGIVTSGSDTSFVNGAMKKIGDDGFTFPIGKGGDFHPLSITAPSSTTDAFTAEFYNLKQSLGSSSDTSIKYLSNCNYWQLLRNNGTSNVNLKLSWNNNACTLADSASLIVSNWNGSSWKNLGNGGITGNKNTGTIINSSSVVTYSYFVLANNACVLKANPGSPFTMCPGDTDLLGGTSTAVHGTSPFVYTWSPSARLKDTTSANPRIGSDSPSSTDTAFYTVYITDDKGCTSTDSIQVIIASPILLNITGNSDTSMFSSNHYGRIDIGITQGDGPVSYLWQYDNHTDSFAANLANGVYPVTLTDTHSCSINQDIAVGDTMQDIEFVENKGQIFDTDGDSVPDILYQSLSVGAKIYLTKNRISYVYSTNMAYADTIPDSLRIDSLYRTDLAFIGSNDTVVVTADYVTEGIRNYYINRDSVTYVHGYRQLTYNNLYSNIDLVITNKGSILYKFIVKDGGNPQDIRFKFFGVDSVYVDSLGNIVARNHLSDINIQSPSAKKDISGTIVSIGSSFVLSNDTFSIATDAVEAMSIAIHHIRPPLVPCAVVQDWTTRYGEIQDQAWDIKMDAQHNKYITGFTSSPNFPTFAVNLPSFGIGTLAFLLKFDANDHPIFATLLGGLANGQFVEGLALDVSTLGANHIFVTGVTDSPDLPLVNPGGGALQRGFITGPSPYIAEYKQTGQLIWFTYCGGSSGNQSGRTLTLDEHSGSTVIYIGGLIDFQTTGFSLANTCSGAYYHSSYSSTYSNSFILEFNSSREISYWTLVAPSADDGSYILHNLKVDSQGNLIVFGETNCAASSFDVVETPPEYTQGHTAGDYDYFIMKLDPCHVILWSSYFGGSGHDGFYPQMASSNCLAIDNADNFYITGETQSYDFPVYNSSSTYAFGRTDVDGFVAKFSSSNHQIWTRYFGGIGYDDSPAAITYNNERNEIFIAGITFSPSYFSPSHFPHAIFGVHPYGGFDQSSLNGNLDGFFAMFDGTSYALKWSTFIGGYWDDAITGLSSSDNELAFSGYSKSIDVVSFSSFPLRHKGNGAYWYNTFHTGENENAIVGAFQICNSPLCMAIDRPAFPDADNVKQSPAQYVNIFPNPSTGIVTIAFADNNEDKGMVEVFNIFGQRIVEMKSLQNNTQLNLSSYPKGLYLIKVTTAKGAITRKVVLE